MALGPAVPTTSFVVVYNPSQYINSITNGQSSERLDALKHLFECITHSDIDLITLGSIWLCVTGLLTNEEQKRSINTETRSYALKCILELVKIEQLQRRFFNLWLSFDFLARYKIVNETDAASWLQCFLILTDDSRNIDRLDDRLRGRLFVQFIDGILSGPMSRSNQAYNTLKDLLTNHCHLRCDELSIIFESIFRHLNRDDDDTAAASNVNHSLNQVTIRKSFEFLCWIIDHQTLNTKLLHYFIQNVVDLHDKYRFSGGLNTELLQLINNHLAKAPWHNTSVIAVLCGIIVERLESPINNDIDPLSTLLFVLTHTLIDIRQCLSITPSHVQVSNDDTIHRKCFLNTLRQLPLCWLTILHRVLVKRQNVNIVLINFQQFLLTIPVKTPSCALSLFDMAVWKMMDEIMRICHQHVIIDQKSNTKTKMIYEDCLNIFEEFASRACCLPQRMVAQLFDIKQLTSITRTQLRESMIKESSVKLLLLLRPNNHEWSVSLRELTEYIVLNKNEALTRRMDVLTTIFDKYLWFKMTDQISHMGQIVLETLENLIHINLQSMDENEFLRKHALMKQTAVKSIFEHFLSDYSIDSHLANHCYRILQEIYEEDCAHIQCSQSIHRPLMELILEQLCVLFEQNLTYTRLTSFNHCSVILKFFLKQLSTGYGTMVSFMQPKIRLLIWRNLLHIRLRASDSCFGLSSVTSNEITYGTYHSDSEQKSTEHDNSLDLRDYLSNLVDCLAQEPTETISAILGYLCNFLKEQVMVHSSHLNIDQLVTFLISLLRVDHAVETTAAFRCLMVCTCYKAQITRIDSLLDCFVSTLNSSQTSLRIMAIQAVIISLSNLRLEIRALLPQIVSHLSTRLNNDTHVAQVMLEFLMHLLFDNASDDSMTPHLFRILIHMTHQSQHQTANNLLLAHTLLCFYFQRLSAPDRQLYAYCLLRSLQPTSHTRDHEASPIERPARLQRSGSLSSLNDDSHNNDMMKRKMTVLEVPPPSMSSTTDDGHPLKKLNDDLTRVTINFINDHLYNVTLPQTIFICLPREVRRHHVNNSWLADEKILYQIKSFDFNQFNKAKDVLATLTHDLDDTTKNRYRRYTDGNRQSMRLKRDLSMLTTCQDDLHVRSLESDTNRSMFNERNLWISVTVRSTTSTKSFLAINLLASPGIAEISNQKLHWFEAIQLNDTGVDKVAEVENGASHQQDKHYQCFINASTLSQDFRSIISNIDRKDQENMLNRHNENYVPQTVHRVPSEARKSIESIDNVDPIRVAKIGVVYIYPGQQITETNILSNIRTSARYQQFMLAMATLKSIRVLQQENFYCPLLDASNPDNCGQYAYVWQNSIYQVLFHASTMMPNTRADHEFKKKLIGNDYVIIVYNESDYAFDMKMLRTGVCQYAIEVCPQSSSAYTRVRLRRKASTTAASQNPSTVDSMLKTDIDYLISDEHVASYVRVLALSLSQQGELETRQRSSSTLPFLISPWQNRLQALRSLHTRCLLSYKHRS